MLQPEKRRDSRAIPERGRDVAEVRAALVLEQRPDLALQVVVEDVGKAVVVEVARVGAHARDHRPLLVVGDAPGPRLLLERAVALVDVEEVRLGVVGDEHVHEAVAVEVGDADAHALARHGAEAGLLRHVLELPVPEVVVQAVRDALVGARVAEDRAVGGRADPVDLRVPVGVVRDHEVEQAVVVVVEEGGAHREQVLRLLVEAGAGGHLAERAVAVVVVEHVRAGVGDEQVRPPVVVVVADRDAVRDVEVPALELRLGRDLLERAVAAVAQQAAVVGGVGPGVLRQLAAVRQEDVEPAVPVVVEERHAAAHRLREVLAPSLVVVVRHVGELGPAGHVAEAHAGRDRGRGAGRRSAAPRARRASARGLARGRRDRAPATRRRAAARRRRAAPVASRLRLFHREHLVRLHVLEHLADAARPLQLEPRDRLVLAEAEVHPQVGGAAVADGVVDVVVAHA